jgi:hypothetical protein
LAIGFVLAAAGTAVALLRHRGLARGREAPGGILIGHVGAYDFHTRWLLGPLFDSIAANVVSSAPSGAAVLEVGCGFLATCRSGWLASTASTSSVSTLIGR